MVGVSEGAQIKEVVSVVWSDFGFDCGGVRGGFRVGGGRWGSRSGVGIEAGGGGGGVVGA